MLLLDQVVDDDPAGDHGQVSGQAAAAAKVAQHGQVVFDDRQKHLRDQVFAIFGGEPQRAALGRVVHHVYDQTDEPIDEILPRPGLGAETTLQKAAIDVR